MVEPGLQHHGGGDLVDHLAPGLGVEAGLEHAAFGGHRGEPLVVHLHRHADHASQAIRPRSRQPSPPARACRRATAAARRPRPSASSIAHEPGDLVVVVPLRLRPVHRGERRGDRAGDVADRDPDALRAEVDAERAHARRPGRPATRSRELGGGDRGEAQRLGDPARRPCRRPWRCRPCRRHRRRRRGRRPGSASRRVARCRERPRRRGRRRRSWSRR